MIDTTGQHPMFELIEAARQLLRKAKSTKLDGIKDFSSFHTIEAKLEAADGLLAGIEGLMEHPYQPSLANGMVDNKPAHMHTERRQADREYAPMEQRLGHMTERGENVHEAK